MICDRSSVDYWWRAIESKFRYGIGDWWCNICWWWPVVDEFFYGQNHQTLKWKSVNWLVQKRLSQVGYPTRKTHPFSTVTALKLYDLTREKVSLFCISTPSRSFELSHPKATSTDFVLWLDTVSFLRFKFLIRQNQQETWISEGTHSSCGVARAKRRVREQARNHKKSYRTFSVFYGFTLWHCDFH